MVIRVYLIETENDYYNIVESVHITKHLNLLDKYSSHKINPNYRHYNIRDDFKSIQTLITDNNDFTFMDLLKTQFLTHEIKSGWFHLTSNDLQSLIQFISIYLEPVDNSSTTTNANYQCLTCQKIFKTKRLLNLHQCQTQYKCPTCSKQFKSLKCYQTHIKNCTPLLCLNCNKTFSSKQSLEKHRLNCGSFTCEKCSKIFNSKYKILQHCQQIHQYTPII